jgi:hypothetical protein
MVRGETQLSGRPHGAVALSIAVLPAAVCVPASAVDDEGVAGPTSEDPDAVLDAAVAAAVEDSGP